EHIATESCAKRIERYRICAQAHCIRTHSGRRGGGFKPAACIGAPPCRPYVRTPILLGPVHPFSRGTKKIGRAASARMPRLPPSSMMARRPNWRKVGERTGANNYSQVKSLIWLARPTGLEPVFPP